MCRIADFAQILRLFVMYFQNPLRTILIVPKVFKCCNCFLVLSAGQQIFRLFVGIPRKNDLCYHQYSGNNCHHGNNSGFLSLCCCRPGKGFLLLYFRIPSCPFFHCLLLAIFCQNCTIPENS